MTVLVEPNARGAAGGKFGCQPQHGTECTMQNLGTHFLSPQSYQTIKLLAVLSEKNDAQRHVWSVLARC